MFGVDAAESEVDMGIDPEGNILGEELVAGPSGRLVFVVSYHMVDNLADGWTGRPLDFGVSIKVGRRSVVSPFGAADVEEAFGAFGPLRPVARVAV